MYTLSLSVVLPYVLCVLVIHLNYICMTEFISIIDSNTRSTKAPMQNNSRQFEGKTQCNIPYPSPFSFPGHHVQLLCQNIWHLADKGDLSFGDCTVALYCLDSSEMGLIFQHATHVG